MYRNLGILVQKTRDKHLISNAGLPVECPVFVWPIHLPTISDHSHFICYVTSSELCTEYGKHVTNVTEHCTYMQGLCYSRHGHTFSRWTNESITCFAMRLGCTGTVMFYSKLKLFLRCGTKSNIQPVMICLNSKCTQWAQQALYSSRGQSDLFLSPVALSVKKVKIVVLIPNTKWRKQSWMDNHSSTWEIMCGSQRYPEPILKIPIQAYINGSVYLLK